MPKAGDDYGSYGSLPSEKNTGVSNAGLNVRADPEAFGAGIGKATAEAGKQVEQIGFHFAQIATEAKVNDDYANKYIPAATKLKSQYDSLLGQDKVAGFENYKNSLNALTKEFSESQPGVLGQTSMAGMTNKFAAGEIRGAETELVESQKKFGFKARGDLMLTNNGLIARNYNNPELVQDLHQQNENHVVIGMIDDGVDPNTEVGRSLIKDAQKNNAAQMATGMIRGAINSGDATSANAFRSRYASVIPGYEKLAIDNVIHTENIRQTSANAATALTIGKPIPVPVGAPAPQIQALVANTAKSSTVNPNHALTVLRIESSDGQDLGTIGTLGQDKESKGKTLEEQAKALCDNLKAAGERATKILGRTSEAWEAYAVYQQGAGGGAALLQADRNANAVEILKPYYDDPEKALSAVKNNGGNATVSVGDFTDHIKQVWMDNERRANCDFADTDNPGEAIMKPYQTALNTAVQPGASPVQSWLNFEKKYPELQAQINSIRNYEERDGIKAYIEEKRQEYARGASAHKNVLVNRASQFVADPNFTDMSQIDSETMAAFFSDRPEVIPHLRTAAEEHANKNTALPLDFSDINKLGPQIATRVDTANLATYTTGRAQPIFTKQDTQKLVNAWQTQTSEGRLNFLDTLSKNLPRSEDFQRVIQQFRPDSPVTSVAGSFLGLHNKMKTESNWFSEDAYTTPRVIAQRLLEGEALLNPTKSDRKEDGLGRVFPMPHDDGAGNLRDRFNEYVGDAFRGSPEVYHQAYQSYKAFYAAESAARGDYKGEIDPARAHLSALSVLGNAIDKNGSKVIAPWGMEEDIFNDAGKIQLDKSLAENGYDPKIFSWDAVKLQNKTGQSGSYYVMMGAGYLLDKTGQPITLNLHETIPAEGGR